jgi:flagellar protein FliO/FliZ
MLQIKMKRLALAIPFLACHLFAAEGAKKPTEPAAKQVDSKIENISIEAIDANSVVTIKLNRHFSGDKPQIEDHGTFFQLKIPDTTVIDSGHFYDGQSPYFKKVAAVQVEEDDALVRIFVSRKSADLMPALTLDLLDDRLMLFLDHAALEKAGVTDHIAKKKEDLAAQVVAATKVENTIPDPTSYSKNLTGGKLMDKLGIVTGFLATIIVVAFAMFYLRGMFGRKAPQAKKAPVLKPIATYAIAPKHKLSLIQVGGQQILIGVSPNGISYLTTVTESTPLPSAPLLEAATFNKTPYATQGNFKKMLNPQPSAVNQRSFESDDSFEKRPAKDKTKNEGIDKSIDDVTSLIRRKLRDLPTL